MCRLRPYRLACALALLASLTPGFAEVVENLGHLVVRGHLAHTEAHGDDHSQPSPEHGCNATFHLCSCHASPSLLQPARSNWGRLAALIGRFRPPSGSSTAAGYHLIPEQPPRA